MCEVRAGYQYLQYPCVNGAPGDMRDRAPDSHAGGNPCHATSSHWRLRPKTLPAYLADARSSFIFFLTICAATKQSSPNVACVTQVVSSSYLLLCSVPTSGKVPGKPALSSIGDRKERRLAPALLFPQFKGLVTYPPHAKPPSLGKKTHPPRWRVLAPAAEIRLPSLR